MNTKKIIKIIIPLLFALAIALGFFQSRQNPYANKVSFVNTSNDSLEGYFKKAQELAKKNDAKTSVTFLAAGDIMLSRNVAEEIKKHNDPLLPFSKMAEILKSTDFNFANLESPITKNGIVGGHTMVFGAPQEYTTGLKEYNFKILNLANNHALDQGLKGIQSTLKTLNALGLMHVGVGENLEQAWQPKIVETNGIKICFVGASFSSINDGGKITNNYVARIEDLENLKSAINSAKKTCDFTVATMHAGTEYTRNPNTAQIKFAHNAIDFGADVVIGAHPHWVQTIERYCPNSATSLPSPLGGEGGRRPDERIKYVTATNTSNCSNPKYIFYSLGNFIFDQEWSRDTKEGLTLKIQISNFKNQNELQGPKTYAKLESIELIPVILENYSTPRPASVEEAKNILQKINLDSKFLY